MKYIAIVLSVFLVSCIGTSEKEEKIGYLDKDSNTSTEEIIKSKNSMIENTFDVYSMKTTFEPKHGWGYQILNNGELYINQPHIPAVSGNKGFDSEAKAATTAEYIIFKLNNGLFPPTVSPEELDSLGVM